MKRIHLTALLYSAVAVAIAVGYVASPLAYPPGIVRALIVLAFAVTVWPCFFAPVGSKLRNTMIPVLALATGAVGGINIQLVVYEGVHMSAFAAVFALCMTFAAPYIAIALPELDEQSAQRESHV